MPYEWTILMCGQDLPLSYYPTLHKRLSLCDSHVFPGTRQKWFDGDWEGCTRAAPNGSDSSRATAPKSISSLVTRTREHVSELAFRGGTA